MENYLQKTKDTHFRLTKFWSSLSMVCVLLLFASQATYAQRVPIPCTGVGSFTIISEDAATATSNDAKMRISGALSGDDRVGFSTGNTYTGTAFAATAKLSTLTGSYISKTLPTPTNTAGTEYTIRVYKADTTCYYDKVFLLEYVNFNTAPVYPDIQVSVAKTPDLGFYALGSTVTIDVIVQNTGTGPATGIEYTVGIPAGLTGVTGVASYGTYDNATKKWTIGNVAVAQTNIKLTLTGTVSTRGIKYLSADLTGEVENDTDSRPTTTANPTNTPGEDDYGSVCISTPFDYCSKDEYTITLPSYTSIKWFKGTTEITAANELGNGVRINADKSLTIFATGEYSYSMTVGPAACPSGGCCPIKVEAGKPPVLVAPLAQSVCFNKPLAAVAATNTQTTSNGIFVYQWYNNNGTTNPTGTAISGQTGLALTTLPTAVGTYSFKLKAFEQGHPNCADSVTVTLEIKDLPTPIIASISPVCTESPINFSATPVGATNYAWSGPNSFTGSNSATPSIASAVLLSAGTYVVTVTNGVGCSATASVSVVVNAKPSIPTVIAKTFCAGDPQEALTATAFGTNTLLWYGNASTGGISSTAFPNYNPTSAGGGLFYVSQKVTATGCESNRAELIVKVNEIPLPPTVAPVSVCQNSNPVTLNVAGSTTGFSILWYGTTSTGGIGSTTASIAPTGAFGTTNYFVSRKADDTKCESNRATIPVEVRAVPVPLLTSNSPVCADSPINLVATPSGANSYLWSGPSGFTGSNIANPTIASASTAKAGTYVVTITNGLNCSASTSVVVIVNDRPEVPTTIAKIFCAGDAEAPLVASTTALGNTLLWYGTSSTGGTSSTATPIYNPISAGGSVYYVAEVNTITQCQSILKSLVVTINEKPLAPVAENKTYCQGVAANPLVASSAAQHTLIWYGTSSTGGSTTNTPTPLTGATGTTTYYVSQKNSLTGCESNRDDAIVIVNRTPVAPTVAAVEYCEKATANVLAATAEAGNTIIWYNGGGTSSTAPTPSTTTAGLTYFYVSQAIPGTNCESGMSGIPVNIKPLPVANVIAVNSLCIGSVAQNNGKFILTRYRNSDEVVQYNTGTSITGATLPILAKPFAGGLFASNLPDPVASQAYTVRIKNSFNCTIDVPAVLTKANCGCPGGFCEPATITKTK